MNDYRQNVLSQGEFLPLHLPARQPVVTYTILGLTIFVFLLQEGSTWLLGGDLPFVLGGKINEFILAGQVWRLITPVLLHGGLAHIFFNMYGLLAFGREQELFMGHGRFLALYLLGGFAGNVMSFLLTDGPSLGASTAIFGLIAAEGVFLYRHRALLGERARAALGNVIGLTVVNLVLGLSPGIDNWGHLGGLLGGLIFAWLAGPRWEVIGLYPDRYVADVREGREAWTAAALVLAIFGGLAALKFVTG